MVDGSAKAHAASETTNGGAAVHVFSVMTWSAMSPTRGAVPAQVVTTRIPVKPFSGKTGGRVQILTHPPRDGPS